MNTATEPAGVLDDVGVAVDPEPSSVVSSEPEAEAANETPTPTPPRPRSPAKRTPKRRKRKASRARAAPKEEEGDILDELGPGMVSQTFAATVRTARTRFETEFERKQALETERAELERLCLRYPASTLNRSKLRETSESLSLQILHSGGAALDLEKLEAQARDPDFVAALLEGDESAALALPAQGIPTAAIEEVALSLATILHSIEAGTRERKGHAEKALTVAKKAGLKLALRVDPPHTALVRDLLVKSLRTAQVDRLAAFHWFGIKG